MDEKMWRKLGLKLINNKIKLRRGREVTVVILFMHIRARSPNFFLFIQFFLSRRLASHSLIFLNGATESRATDKVGWR